MGLFRYLRRILIRKLLNALPNGLYEMDSEGLDEVISTRTGLMQLIEQLRGGAKARLRYDEIRAYIFALGKKAGRIYQVYSLPGTLDIHRARLLNYPDDKQAFKRGDLGHPPSEKTIKYGRCHQKHNPVCYCSLSEDTALAEVGAQVGNYYVISTFDISLDIRLVPIGEFDYYRRTNKTYLGETSSEVYEKLIEEGDWIDTGVIDAFFADEFIQRAMTNTDYYITSSFSDLLFNELEKPIDALVYPSVAFRGGINFAVTPDAYNSKMVLNEKKTRIVRIDNNLGYGIYEYSIIDKLKSVVDEGVLEWATCS